MSDDEPNARPNPPDRGDGDGESGGKKKRRRRRGRGKRRRSPNAPQDGTAEANATAGAAEAEPSADGEAVSPEDAKPAPRRDVDRSNPPRRRNRGDKPDSRSDRGGRGDARGGKGDGKQGSPPGTGGEAKPKARKKRKPRTKQCVSCFTPCSVVHKVRLDHRKQWVFICDICWPSRCIDNPHYEFQATWSSGRITRPGQSNGEQRRDKPPKHPKDSEHPKTGEERPPEQEVSATNSPPPPPPPAASDSSPAPGEPAPNPPIEA